MLAKFMEFMVLWGLLIVKPQMDWPIQICLLSAAICLFLAVSLGLKAKYLSNQRPRFHNWRATKKREGTRTGYIGRSCFSENDIPLDANMTAKEWLWKPSRLERGLVYATAVLLMVGLILATVAPRIWQSVHQ